PALAAVGESDRPRVADLRRVCRRLRRRPVLRRRGEPGPGLQRLAPGRRPQPTVAQHPSLGTVPHPPAAGLLTEMNMAVRPNRKKGTTTSVALTTRTRRHPTKSRFE